MEYMLVVRARPLTLAFDRIAAIESAMNDCVPVEETFFPVTTTSRVLFATVFENWAVMMPLAWIERAISPFTVHIGFKSDLDLTAFLTQTDLDPVSIEKVNIPRIWSLITCIKD